MLYRIDALVMDANFLIWYNWLSRNEFVERIMQKLYAFSFYIISLGKTILLAKFGAVKTFQIFVPRFTKETLFS